MTGAAPTPIGGAPTGRRFGDPMSSVELVADHYGAGPLPDLDVLPGIASVLGVDRNPIDVLDTDARR